MSKLKSILSIFAISVICIFFLANFVQATDVDMNLSNNTANTTTTSNSTNQTTSTNTAGTIPTPYTSGASVSTLNNTEDGLGLTNTLNIILIVIGVLLLLLGIAILIRLKK